MDDANVAKSEGLDQSLNNLAVRDWAVGFGGWWCGSPWRVLRGRWFGRGIRLMCWFLTYFAFSIADLKCELRTLRDRLVTLSGGATRRPACGLINTLPATAEWSRIGRLL